MAGEKAEPNAARTPARPAPKPAGPVSSSSKQRSIMSFFQKSSPGPASSPCSRDKVSPDTQRSSCLQETTKANSLPKPKPESKPKASSKPSVKLSTPVPSSDMIEPPSSQENADPVSTVKKPTRNPSFSSATTKSTAKRTIDTTSEVLIPSSPSRKAKKVVSYAESSDDEQPFNYGNSTQRSRRRGGARPAVKEEDDYDDEDGTDRQVDDDNDGMLSTDEMSFE
ncbi:hypothetical protein E4U21_003045 [Claviceps maximensis]|nr:hypothetical protein E4U21_003045 [Claviceps maximensis]